MNEKREKLLSLFILIALVLISLLILIVTLSNRFQVKIDDIVNVGTRYQDAFTATFRGNDVTKRVKVASNIYDGSEGNYQLTFTYSYKGKEYTSVKTVEVKDIEVPTLTLVKGNEVTLVIDKEFVEPGFHAVDNYDGHITNKVVVTGEINNKKIGKYTLTYTVIDSSKNKKVLKRIVNVVAKLPTEMDKSDFTLANFYTRAMPKKNNDDVKYSENLLVIGDKSAANFATYGFIDIKNIWYSDVLTLGNALETDLIVNGVNSKTRLLDQLGKAKDKNIVLYFGYTGFNNNYINDYRNLIKEIKNKSDSNIVVLSLLPIYKENDKFNQKIVNDMNYYLLEMCNQEGAYFLNVASEFKNNKESNYLANGMDLSKTGKQIVYDYINNNQIKRK